MLTHILHLRGQAINAIAMLAPKFSRSADCDSGLSQLLSAVECRALENRNVWNLVYFFVACIQFTVIICVTINMSASSSIAILKINSCLRICLRYFFYTHLFYKQTQTQIFKKLSTLLSTSPAWDFEFINKYYHNLSIVS